VYARYLLICILIYIMDIMNLLRYLHFSKLVIYVCFSWSFW